MPRCSAACGTRPASASGRATCAAARCSSRARSSRSSPLVDPDLPAATARALAAELRSAHFHSEAGVGVASADLLGPEFDRRRYWRGPVWANLNWLLARGLRAHGLEADAAALEATTLRLAAAGGMREYFDPLTGAGRGVTDFSWTAAVVVDQLCSARIA